MAKHDIPKRRMKGYYSFSKNYPLPNGTEGAISETPKMIRRQRRRRIFAVLACCCLFVTVFIAASFCYNLTTRPLPEGDGNRLPVITADNVGTVRAIFIDNGAIGDISQLSRMLEEAKENGFNAVMLDFKTREGYAVYPTVSGYSAPESFNAVDSVIIDKIKSSGMMLLARIFCYRDSVAPQRLGAFVAEDEERTKIWLDAPAVEGGSPWLNPASPAATDYLCSIIGEVQAMGVDGIYLQSVQFAPAREGTAQFYTEKDAELNRNAVLLSFIDRAVQTAGDTPVIIGVPLNGAEGGDAALWGGTLFDTAASVCSPFIESGAEGDYVSAVEEKYISLNENVKNNFSTIKVIPTVKNQPENGDFYKKMAESGAESYIIVP